MSPPDQEPDEQPQWVKSRLKAVSRMKDCGPTHGACKCFVARIVELEAELSRLRADRTGEEADTAGP